MAWEWVGPAATAALGAMGIGATLWTSERARQSAERQALIAIAATREERARSERREVYARLLAAMDAGRGDIIKVFGLKNAGNETDAALLYSEHMHTLQTISAEVTLLASAEVALEALEASQEVIEWLDHAWNHSDLPKLDGGKRSQLVRIMRAELSTTAADSLRTEDES